MPHLLRRVHVPLLPRAPGAALLLLAALVLAGCSKHEVAPEPVRAVKLMTVGVSAYQTGIEYAGEVRPRIESRLGFRVAGKIVRRHVELGQNVRVGQLLAELDAQDLRLAAAASQAQMAAATTNRDLAQADLRRYKELREQNFISGAELERRDASFKAAQAQLEQAQAQLTAQGNQTGYARLVADVAGVVTAVEAEPGQVVAAGTPVIRLAQSGVRDVVFAVPEDRVREIKVGSPVQVRVWSSDEDFPGTVREVAASADPVTRTFQVKVALNTRTPPPLGTTVTVVPSALNKVGTPVIKLPTSALRNDNKGGSAVWVFDAASASVVDTPVVVATADGNEVVIASGLPLGAQVVVAGVHVLSPGQKVTVYQPRKVVVAPGGPVAEAAAPAAPATSASR